MSTIESLNTFQQLANVRLVAATNQTGTYFNGPTNNGVGATFTYATGALTIDSVVVNLNDYILFSGQSAGYQNGIWQCTQVGATGVAAVLQRRGDFQCREQIHGGQFVPVSAGTTYAGSVWTVIEPLPAAIGLPTDGGIENAINFSTITAGGSSLFLQSANNLSDVASAPTSVTNLGFTQTAATISGAVTQLGTLQSASVTLTPTQMAAAYATPIQLIANPLASQMILVLSAQVYTASTGHTAYATGTAPIIQYGTGGTNGAHGAGMIAVGAGLVAGDINAAASQVRNLPQFASAANTGFSGEGVYFSNATGAYTAGTGTNVTFTLQYVTLTATV
jgi:hypothetical protein